MLSLGFAVIACVLTLAQRLGDWRSKTVAWILGCVALFSCVGWFYLAALWLLEVDIRIAFAERSTAFWITTSALSAVSIAALLLARLRQRRLQRISDLAKDFSSNRPWVSINDIEITSPLTFGSAGGRIEVSYKIVNTGHSPAIRITWDSAIVPLTDTRLVADEIREAQSAICVSLEASRRRSMDTALSPGDEIPQRASVGIAQGSIDEVTRRRYENRQNAPDRFISMALILCFDYQVSFMPDHHHTRYAFMIANIPHGGGYNPSIVPQGTHLDLRLVNFNQSTD